MKKRLIFTLLLTTALPASYAHSASWADAVSQKWGTVHIHASPR
ncbi:MAG: hypothetical protein ACOYNW_15470 [Undibacterium curvum]